MGLDHREAIQKNLASYFAIPVKMGSYLLAVPIFLQGLNDGLFTKLDRFGRHRGR